ncbi:MAG: hypothetical protein R2753_09740 [Chitinophagales bacterium]
MSESGMVGDNTNHGVGKNYCDLKPQTRQFATVAAHVGVIITDVW